MMRGYLVLNGGDAFSPRTKSIDHNWLSLIRRQSRPRVMVVPTASVEKTRKVADETMRYFNYLGTFAEYRLITTPLEANTATEYEDLDKVDAVILTDGSPIDMVEILRGSKTEAALRRLLERKAALMATGASAMAIGGAFWFGGEWEPGLGIAPHLAVLPHHNLVQMRLSPAQLLARLPEGVTLIGIDDTTAVIAHPDGTYHVDGAGEVMVYRDADHQDVYRAKQTFTLAAPEAE